MQIFVIIGGRTTAYQIRKSNKVIELLDRALIAGIIDHYIVREVRP